ncbi:hypothetical protein [Streptomyces justiciae]|uniref:hypothetical protein n=1 Tax=Streptomyces justiciae TaxID=2780140 RepID=UPI0021187827|nr:hypothetical protein [Streptomyces justiciae]MCW8376085.1 hypothetical protein [Streptomyces justiciae]
MGEDGRGSGANGSGDGSNGSGGDDSRNGDDERRSGGDDSRSGGDGTRNAGGDGWRTSLTALAMASVLAFVTVFFGWLPNPFVSGEEGPAGGTAQSTPSSPAAPSKSARVEVVARGFPAPRKVPAKFRDDTRWLDGTVLATRLTLTLRNPGELKAAIGEFRFTLREVRNLEPPEASSRCLPNTGGITKITADYDVDLSPAADQDLPVTVSVDGDYDLAAGEVERVLFTLGDAPTLDPRLYLVDITLMEGPARTPVPAGSVAFVGPLAYDAPAGLAAELDTADDYLRRLHAAARSDRSICDNGLIAEADRILSAADDLSPEAERLKSEIDVLRQRRDSAH